MSRKENTRYYLVDKFSEVKILIPGDIAGEFLALQYVYPIIDGLTHPQAASFRLIRLTKEGRWKAQSGQAQYQDLRLPYKLMKEMSKLRGIELDEIDIQVKAG